MKPTKPNCDDSTDPWEDWGEEIDRHPIVNPQKFGSKKAEPEPPVSVPTDQRN